MKNHLPWPVEIRKVYPRAQIFMVKLLAYYKQAYLTKEHIFPLDEYNKELVIEANATGTL